MHPNTQPLPVVSRPPPVPHDEPHVAPVPVKVAVAHPEKTGHPDGVPHDIIGMLAYGIAVLAGATLLSWLLVGIWLAVIVAIVGGVLLAKNLPKRSTRERKVEAREHVVEHVHNQELNQELAHTHDADPYDAHAPHGSRHV